MVGSLGRKIQVFLLTGALSFGVPHPSAAQNSTDTTGVDQTSAETYVILAGGISAAVLALCAPYIKHIARRWNLRYGLDKGECCFYFCRGLFCGRPEWRQDEYADDLIQNTLIKASRYLIAQNQSVAAGLLLRGLPDDEDIEAGEVEAMDRPRHDLFGRTEEAGALRLELLQGIQTYLNREGHEKAARLMTPHVLRDIEILAKEEGRAEAPKKKKKRKHKKQEVSLGQSDEDVISIRKISGNAAAETESQILKNEQPLEREENHKEFSRKKKEQRKEGGLGTSDDGGIYTRRGAGKSKLSPDEQE